MASRFNIEEHSQVEGLLSVLSFVLAAEKLDFEDLEALRLTSKAFKQDLDPILFRKLVIKIEGVDDNDTFQAISESSILEHVRDLELLRWRNFAGMNAFWNRQRRFILSILVQAAPRLERLEITATNSSVVDFPLTSSLLKRYDFPQLKILELTCRPTEMMVLLVQKRLYSMPKVQKLVLSSSWNSGEKNFYKNFKPADLEIIAQTPFLENLYELELNFRTIQRLRAPFTSLMLQARRLQKLTLNGDGVQQLAMNASNMPHLRCLEIQITTVGDLQSIADAGRNGNWRLLKKMVIRCMRVPAYMMREQVEEAMRPVFGLQDHRQYCKDVLEPIFGPGLDLMVLVVI